jgi:hypothetical protein
LVAFLSGEPAAQKQREHRRGSQAARWLNNKAILIFFSVLPVYLLTLNTLYASDHPTSLLELDYSIWTRHSFVLGAVGSFNPNSVDVFAYKGYYYSALAPGTSIFALPFAGIGFILDGGFSVFGNASFLAEFFIALVNSGGAAYLFLLARRFLNPSSALFVAYAYAFSTIAWPFATVFFQHDLSAFLTITGVYYSVVFVKNSSKGGTHYAPLAVAALSMGAAFTVDYVDGLFIAIVSIYVLTWVAKNHRSMSKALIALSPIMLGLGFIGFYNYSCFGSPFLTSEQAYQGSINIFADFNTPLPYGVAVNLFTPYRGLLVYSPVLIAGFLGLLKARRRIGVRDTLFLGSLFLSVFLAYSAWTDLTGGLSFGPRFLIPSIPYLLIFAGFLFQGSRSKLLMYLLYLVGVFENGVGALTTALGVNGDIWTSPLIVHNLPLFLHGSLDVWWLNRVGTLWFVPAIIILLYAGGLPYLALKLLKGDYT